MKLERHWVYTRVHHPLGNPIVYRSLVTLLNFSLVQPNANLCKRCCADLWEKL